MKITIKRRETLAEHLQKISRDQYRIFHDIEEEHIRVYDEFAKQFISEILTKARVKAWKIQGYVVIAQTGTGKSTWVTRTIGEILLEHHSSALLITPRVALTLQYKREIAQLYCPNLLEELTEQGLHKRNAYGPFNVYSLQEFVSSVKEQTVMKKTYEFVILDEVHAFVGDAAFNPVTEKIFHFLLENVGKTAKRVYLTATPEIILDEIARAEEKITPEFIPQYDFLGWPKVSIRLTIFRFKRDYGYVQPIFFQKEDFVFKIVESLPKEKKGLIFVRSMKQGLEWQARLGNQRAVYLDAKNKRAEREDAFHELLRNQKIDQQFLIVTRFMDVGVNLKDVELKVVVLFHFYPEDMIQMLGRKRTSDGETVELYIKLPSAAEIRGDLGKIKLSEEEVRKNIRFLGSRKYYCQFEHPFCVMRKGDDYILHVNGFFMRYLAYRKRFLMECLQDESNSQTFVENLSKKLLSYLPGCSEPIFLDYLQENDEEIRKQAREKLEQWIDQELNRDDMGILSDQLLEIFGETRRPEQKGQIATGKLNGYLKRYGFPYTISNQSKKGKKGIWKIERGISA